MGEPGRLVSDAEGLHPLLSPDQILKWVKLITVFSYLLYSVVCSSPSYMRVGRQATTTTRHWPSDDNNSSSDGNNSSFSY